MKLINLILIFSFLIFFDVSIAKNADKNLHIRNIKLANSYRESKNYNKALDLLNRSKKALEGKKDWNSKYWVATINEYYGYLFRDMNFIDESRASFENALKLFRALITQKDGSPYVIDEILKNIENIDNEINNLNPFDFKLAGANVLNYDNLKLKELPNDIPQKVTNISFNDNKFKEIPSNLSSYKSIKYLSFKKNKLTTISESLYELNNLVWLDLSNNKIKNISKGIKKLNKLKVLDLSNNKLKEIPVEINQLNSLKVLNLKGNKIKFDIIKNLIKSMPNTNILHDIYVLENDENDEIINE